jgi:hypothetical protein
MSSLRVSTLAPRQPARPGRRKAHPLGAASPLAAPAGEHRGHGRSPRPGFRSGHCGSATEAGIPAPVAPRSRRRRRQIRCSRPALGWRRVQTTAASGLGRELPAQLAARSTHYKVTTAGSAELPTLRAAGRSAHATRTRRRRRSPRGLPATSASGRQGHALKSCKFARGEVSPCTYETWCTVMHMISRAGRIVLKMIENFNFACRYDSPACHSLGKVPGTLPRRRALSASLANRAAGREGERARRPPRQRRRRPPQHAASLTRRSPSRPPAMDQTFPFADAVNISVKVPDFNSFKTDSRLYSQTHSCGGYLCVLPLRAAPRLVFPSAAGPPPGCSVRLALLTPAPAAALPLPVLLPSSDQMAPARLPARKPGPQLLGVP